VSRLVAALVLALALVVPSWANENPFFDVKGLAPHVVNFTTEKAAQDLAQTRRVVYFFAADWCELCAADLEQLRHRTAELPADVTIVLVDFEDSDDLRLKYGIPLQDVFLQIDATGKKKTLWVGGGIPALLKKIKD